MLVSRPLVSRTIGLDLYVRTNSSYFRNKRGHIGRIKLHRVLIFPIDFDYRYMFPILYLYFSNLM